MHLTPEQLTRQQQSARYYQRLYDDTLAKVGQRAPAPILGQSVNDYRREQLRNMKKQWLQNHDLYRVNMRGLPDEAVPIFEGQVLEAVPIEAFNPLNVPKGEIREVVQIQPNGLKIHNFIGQDHFCRAMGRPGRRVAGFYRNVEPVQEYSNSKVGWGA
jgi:hypothetical protein